jgi:TRAP-type C4-dicarboxylate transport system permease large subunit
MLYRGVLPFLAINAVGLLLVTYIPQIALTLPGHSAR